MPGLFGKTATRSARCLRPREDLKATASDDYRFSSGAVDEVRADYKAQGELISNFFHGGQYDRQFSIVSTVLGKPGQSTLGMAIWHIPPGISTSHQSELARMVPNAAARLYHRRLASAGLGEFFASIEQHSPGFWRADPQERTISPKP